MRKFIFAALVCLFAVSLGCACDFEYDEGTVVNPEVVYTLVESNAGNYYVVGKCETLAEAGLTEEGFNALGVDEKAEQLGIYGGGETSIVIPAEHNGLPVKGVGAYAFFLSGVQEVTLPHTVEFIGRNAFNSCVGLKTVKVGDGVNGSQLKRIGQSAFLGNYALQKVYLYGETLASVPEFNAASRSNIFYATDYPAVVVPNHMAAEYRADGIWRSYSSYVVGESGVYNNGIIAWDGQFVKYTGGETSVTVVDGITEIGAYAFKNTDITEVFLPDSLVGIGRQAFYSCKKLVRVAFTNAAGAHALASIGSNAFSDCVSLKTVNLPERVSIIKERAFYNCTSLTSVYINGRSINVYANAFLGCTSIADVFFVGSEEEFNSSAIIIGDGNTSFSSANIHYNYMEV